MMGLSMIIYMIWYGEGSEGQSRGWRSRGEMATVAQPRMSRRMRRRAVADASWSGVAAASEVAPCV